MHPFSGLKSQFSMLGAVLLEDGNGRVSILGAVLLEDRDRRVSVLGPVVTGGLERAG